MLGERKSPVLCYLNCVRASEWERERNAIIMRLIGLAKSIFPTGNWLLSIRPIKCYFPFLVCIDFFSSYFFVVLMTYRLTNRLPIQRNLPSLLTNICETTTNQEYVRLPLKQSSVLCAIVHRNFCSYLKMGTRKRPLSVPLALIVSIDASRAQSAARCIHCVCDGKKEKAVVAQRTFIASRPVFHSTCTI